MLPIQATGYTSSKNTNNATSSKITAKIGVCAVPEMWHSLDKHDVTFTLGATVSP